MRLADQPAKTPELADQARCFGLIGAMLRDLAPLGYLPADSRVETLRRNVLGIFDVDGSRRVAVDVRVSAAEALGRAGDPRPGVGLRTDRRGIPDLLWCDIPAGTLQMGSFQGEEDAVKNEYGPGGKPLPVEIEAFRLAAYPVTCAQFRPFVEDGYENSDYWTEAGWKWKDTKERNKPDLWDDPRWNVENYPVVGVSWYEAVAWCRWCTARLREAGSTIGVFVASSNSP